MKDIRWVQRYSNFKKALEQLDKAFSLSKKRKLSELEKSGVIQTFEYTFELAWKTLKDFLEYKGNYDILGSRDAIKLALQY
jgi:nucleotidyltransferase substrate binding protein (TIGR01987 family)